LFFNKFREHVDWSPANKDITLLAFIWFCYSIFELINPEARSTARLLIKESGIIAGLAVAKRISELTDVSSNVEWLKEDGDAIEPGEVAFIIEGNAQNILSTERLILNCMQRMSGIATKTHALSQLIAHTSAKLLDTRKTTPGFRLLEKEAVLIGGGSNHRFGLYDMIMLKDNHIDFAGGVKQAIEKTHQYQKFKGLNLPIEIETRNLEEVRQVMEIGGVTRIMLDNFKPEQLKEAIALIGGKFETEASGGITIGEGVQITSHCAIVTHSSHRAMRLLGEGYSPLLFKISAKVEASSGLGSTPASATPMPSATSRANARLSTLTPLHSSTLPG
jgi:nicotinate-nucleotide pyrophosphorylase (carboxylating)